MFLSCPACSACLAVFLFLFCVSLPSLPAYMFGPARGSFAGELAVGHEESQHCLDPGEHFLSPSVGCFSCFFIYPVYNIVHKVYIVWTRSLPCPSQQYETRHHIPEGGRELKCTDPFPAPLNVVAEKKVLKSGKASIAALCTPCTLCHPGPT